jgi:hypothetical protein
MLSRVSTTVLILGAMIMSEVIHLLSPMMFLFNCYGRSWPGQRRSARVARSFVSRLISLLLWLVRWLIYKGSQTSLDFLCASKESDFPNAPFCHRRGIGILVTSAKCPPIPQRLLCVPISNTQRFLHCSAPRGGAGTSASDSSPPDST